jgi:mono/diheme cytochrome c family protein/uncharacterized membrane protein
MATNHILVHLYRFASFLLLVELGAGPVSAPQTVFAQADSFRSSPKQEGTPVAGELFRKQCVKCHGAEGSGKAARAKLPEVPDFTDAAWQRKRSDAQLLTSILDGKDVGMPSWSGKLSEDQVRGLVAYIRAFAPTAGMPQDASTAHFRKRYKELEERLHELQKESRRLSEEEPGPAPVQPPQSKGSRSSAQKAAGTPAAGELFRKHCMKCHGAEGSGKAARAKLPEVPDFTDAAWQKKRSDARLLTSILDGKDDAMPSWSGKLSEDQARGLVAYIRTFAPTAGTPQDASPVSIKGSHHGVEQGQQKSAPASARIAAGEEPRRFLVKLARWLGRFHPPAVHFPIALLTAAAAAELLRTVTGRLGFEAVSRFTIWFGTFGAVIAGVLGWFLGGLRLADASRVMITHCWLGIVTVLVAVVLLVMSELSRLPERRRTRIWFRLTLLAEVVLVSVAGFFGGAIVFGVDHYAWPH